MAPVFLHAVTSERKVARPHTTRTKNDDEKWWKRTRKIARDTIEIPKIGGGPPLPPHNRRPKRHELRATCSKRNSDDMDTVTADNGDLKQLATSLEKNWEPLRFR